MIILGLGSNVGDRLSHLRQALRAIERIPNLSIQQVSPVYISDALLPDNAPSEWDMPYLNLALRCEVSCAPQALLSQLKQIEKTLGREIDSKHWGPRIIDIDILAWDTDIIKTDTLMIPRENMLSRPFQLFPFADIAPDWIYPLPGSSKGKTIAELVEALGSRFTGDAPFRTRQIYHRIDTPQLVGVVNVNPDSFSDGGKFISVENAIKHAAHLTASGANILDLGAESTAPNAPPIDAETEWSRLEPVLSAILSQKKHFLIPPKISVDTRHAAVAEKALKLGIDWINDVTGFENKAMREVVARSAVDCVMMHHLSIPASRSHVIPPHLNPISVINAWAEKQLDLLESSGISRERIIFDPGIGFGKVAAHSLMLIQHINEFEKLGVRVLVGHSRKSFYSMLTPYPAAERDIETLATSLYLAKQKVDYLRVHNVEMCARGIKVITAMQTNSHIILPVEAKNV